MLILGWQQPPAAITILKSRESQPIECVDRNLLFKVNIVQVTSNKKKINLLLSVGISKFHKHNSLKWLKSQLYELYRVSVYHKLSWISHLKKYVFDMKERCWVVEGSFLGLSTRRTGFKLFTIDKQALPLLFHSIQLCPCHAGFACKKSSVNVNF